MTQEDSVRRPCWREDADFIAHSREDVPYLLSLIDSLTAERDRWYGLAERAEPIIRDLKDANMRLLARAEAAEADREWHWEHLSLMVKAARLVREEQQAEYECGFCTGGNDSHDDECVMPPFLAALTHIEESLGGRS